MTKSEIFDLMSDMEKFFISFCLIFSCVLGSASEIKEQIDVFKKELNAARSARARGEIHFKLASLFFQDQEVDKAFQHFLCALKALPLRSAPEMNSEEKNLYDQALADYLNGAGSDPVRVAKQMLEKYGDQAEGHRDWIHLNFLLSTAYANLGLYADFFERFYNGYGYLGETFLAYKTQGILYLRLSQRGSSAEERHANREEAFAYLSRALECNPIDSSLYKVLIFLAKDEKNDALVLNYLQKMVEQRAHISRGDIYIYVREAVALGELELGQQIIDLARGQYEFSRAISAAQEYLNQCRG